MNEKQSKRKMNVIIVLLAAFIILILLLLLRSCQSGKPPPNVNDTTTESKTLDFVPNNETSQSIIIPGVNGINLKSNQLKQKVDFYNPAKNNCYFRITLYLSDDTLIWQSGLIKPSEHITEITLNQKLQRGLYSNCRLVYDCYTLDEKSPLNGGQVKLEINSY